MKKTLKEHYLSTLEEADEKLMVENDYFAEWFDDWLADQESVEEGSPDHHRWFYTIDKVLKVVIDYEERFFTAQFTRTTGDTELEWEYYYNSPEDCLEVHPKEVMTTIYVSEENL